MRQRSKALLVLAGVFDVTALTLLINEEAAGAGASVMGSIASLILIYYTDAKSTLAPNRSRQLPDHMGARLHPAEYDALVAELARIDQQIEQTKKVIVAAEDRDTERTAEMTLADLENERYDIEAKLRRG